MDHFSDNAVGYSRYRPHYPETLFAHLASLCRQHDTALDCGTGSGQVAVGLAGHFRQVVAMDTSAQQIAQARLHPHVRYTVGQVESTNIKSGSVDLVTAGQSLHWFRLPEFYTEVKRVLRPQGFFAAWCYGLLAIETDVDRVIQRFYSDVVGPYWPPRRKLIEARYQSIDFPFQELTSPVFRMEEEWTLDELKGYLGTWSSVRAFIRKNNADPIALIGSDLRTAWGQAERRTARWTLCLRIGAIHQEQHHSWSAPVVRPS